MRWTSNWRIYYVAAALFIIAAVIALANDGVGIRPVFGFAMAAGMAMIGTKARRETTRDTPPS